jgi:lipid II isoglutaminyl synthase (glutamine-hydrolysing)
LAGFENHGGRTYLGAGAQPLAKVIHGFGNDGRSGYEGAQFRNAFGCYLHGPVLPKNPAFADRLISLAIQRRYGDGSLPALDDSLEDRAHRAALAAR